MDAFEQLYDLHKSSIYRTALAITSDKMTAEEILQETFLRAFKHITRIHDGVSLAPWLYRIAVNLAYDLTARRKRGLNMLNKVGFFEIFCGQPQAQSIRNLK
jgi:RNA polymerase sigma-70 factor (ECF subfamily)